MQINGMWHDGNKHATNILLLLWKVAIKYAREKERRRAEKWMRARRKKRRNSNNKIERNKYFEYLRCASKHEKAKPKKNWNNMNVAAQNFTWRDFFFMVDAVFRLRCVVFIFFIGQIYVRSVHSTMHEPDCFIWCCCYCCCCCSKHLFSVAIYGQNCSRNFCLLFFSISLVGFADDSM